MTYSYDREPPGGYTFVRTQDGSARILLSAKDAEVLTQRRLEEQIAAEAERERLRRERATAVEEVTETAQVATTAVPAPSADDASQRPCAAAYRVVHGFDELERRFETGALAMRTPDDDVKRRLAAVVKRLREMGPDRLIAKPAQWRSGMSTLRATFPNFAAPLDLVANTLALAEATQQPIRIPPMLLLGPPGVGKTYFSNRLAEFLGAPFERLSMDQVNGPAGLFGTSSHWSNTQFGILFGLLCLGSFANPVILLDEMDKGAYGLSNRSHDALAQLHGALEPETSRRAMDQSLDIAFDASLVTYIGTANSLQGIGAPILSRCEVFEISPPDSRASIDIAHSIAEQLLRSLGLEGKVNIARKGMYVLAHLSPRLMNRMLGKAVAASVAAGSSEVSEEQLLLLCGLGEGAPALH